MCKKYLVKMVGSEKSYLFLKMQIAIMASVVVAILYTLFKNYLYLLHVIPAVILFFSFIDMYKKYKKEFWIYFALFTIIFLIILLIPFAFQNFSLAAGGLQEWIRYLIYAIFAVLALLILSRSFQLKKEVTGKVLLADKTTAVVEVDFDLLAGVKAGRYVVENKGAKKGDLVRISIRKGFFRGTRLNKIMGRGL